MRRRLNVIEKSSCCDLSPAYINDVEGLPMDIRHYRSFIALAEEGSFTSAARRLNLVQSGLSVTIKEMEEELGVKLVQRTTRRVSLTDAGLLFLEYARPALTMLNDGIEAVRSPRAALSEGGSSWAYSRVWVPISICRQFWVSSTRNTRMLISQFVRSTVYKRQNLSGQGRSIFAFMQSRQQSLRPGSRRHPLPRIPW